MYFSCLRIRAPSVYRSLSSASTYRSTSLATATAPAFASHQPTESHQSQPPANMAATTSMAFSQMAGRLNPNLLNALDKMQYANMTPVQQQVLQLPTFNQDCLVQAKTGTGKTIAFLLPALNNLLSNKGLQRSNVGLLVLAPTRELAQQIADECDKLTSLCQPPLECHLAVGGSNRKSQLSKFLNGNPTILVATPGRLTDYLSEAGPRKKLSQVRCVVLDEADRMLDAGFMPALVKILEQLPPKAEAGWQGMCFSATMPPEINKVLHLVLKPNHVRLSTLSENDTPTVDAIPQSLIQVKGVEDVFPTLHRLLSCERIDNPSLKAIIFSSTARQAGLMYHIFGHTGGASPGKLPVWQMNSRMSQPARNRTVEEFKATDRGLLFASDVVGRGMDFPDIGLVIQIGLPLDKEQYVHRVGRTGRAGKGGRAVSILTPEEMPFVRRNRQFPIKETTLTHPKANEIPSEKIIGDALAKVPEENKAQAYVAFLGFTKTLKRIHGMDAPEVVKLANRFAGAMGLDGPPPIEPSTVSKMGLKGVPGLVIFGKNGVPKSESKRPNPRNGSGMKKDLGDSAQEGRSGGGGGGGGGDRPAAKRPRRGKY
ncbi:P-loop containing nucleoside triphosphate hydrolase protein [Apodospora peruviana]|uniref:ATP-dependent RNA helicase n=1 Tax=Apodospora peruviana TaxID=516989 RepID=A0AAE0MBE7_9PEZI|nr:P-loop containing nucleoside triphosphate hydrolase protein [Apodospora peruviana]